MHHEWNCVVAILSIHLGESAQAGVVHGANVEDWWGRIGSLFSKPPLNSKDLCAAALCYRQTCWRAEGTEERVPAAEQQWLLRGAWNGKGQLEQRGGQGKWLKPPAEMADDDQLWTHGASEAGGLVPQQCREHIPPTSSHNLQDWGVTTGWE